MKDFAFKAPEGWEFIAPELKKPAPPPTVMMMAPGVEAPANGQALPPDMPAHVAIPMPAPAAVGHATKYPSMDPSQMGAVSKKQEAEK